MGAGHAQVVDLEDLGLDGDSSVGDVVAADDDVVGVEGLGDADGGSAGGTEVGREAEVIERVLAVVAGDGEEACGGEPLIESVGEGLADPCEVGLAGAIVEGKDENDSTGGSCWSRGLAEEGRGQRTPRGAERRRPRGAG